MRRFESSRPSHTLLTYPRNRPFQEWAKGGIGYTLTEVLIRNCGWARNRRNTMAKSPNAAFMKPLKPSAELAAVVGSEPLARSEVVSKMWEYIKKNNLQNPANKREIISDDKLRPIFGKDKVT